jgi:hypothetical protein
VAEEQHIYADNDDYQSEHVEHDGRSCSNGTDDSPPNHVILQSQIRVRVSDTLAPTTLGSESCHSWPVANE